VVVRVAIERCELGRITALVAQLDDGAHAGFLADEIGLVSIPIDTPIVGNTDVSARGAGDVDDYVHIALADQSNHFPVERRVGAYSRAFDHADTHHGSARLGCRYRSIWVE
jgi:hypothetical protein